MIEAETLNIVAFPMLRANLGVLYLDEAIECYLAARRMEGLQPSSIQGYKTKLNDFSRAIGPNFDVTKLDPIIIQRYFAILQGRGYKPGYSHDYFCTFNKFCEWLVNTDVVERNPMKKLIKPRRPKRRFPSYYKDRHVEKLRVVCRLDTYCGQRDWAALMMTMHAGLRAGEIADLTFSQVDLDAGYIFPYGKGGKDRPVPIFDELWPELLRWMEVRERYFEYFGMPDLQIVFPTRNGKRQHPNSISDNFNQWGKKAGITDIRVSPHTGRHYFATKLIEDGCDPYAVQVMLGHTSQIATQIYVHATGSHIKREAERIKAKRKIRGGRTLFPTKL